MLTFT